MTTPHVFSLSEVCCSYAGEPALHPLTLDIPAGQVVGLLGHNGSGKSTLMKILARQIAPASGKVRFEGRPLEEYAPRELARLLSHLPQHNPDTDGLTVRELVALGRYPWHGPFGRTNAADREHCANAMASTGTLRFADRLVDSLSGGERQRAFLAMLVAQDARCMLLDEPISALDIAQQYEIMDLVTGLSRADGRSVIVILHDINIAARYCDRILMLSGGHLAAFGPPEELVQPGQLHRLFGVRLDVFPHPETGRPVSYVL
ncbi:ABC transporter ATP-binding protein [Nisaea acidiphila]|uniref:ABC transporter ATP-binding protein n=1 Tax=Nisaea acidiphila TaxID=1862145 RepID=A0A9J7AV47_9PROT|nr:ABC transporter ATP-binding protein [Nisaea acidiphila]UUX49285.1 ABC transporter ATP-binding protein [Nisaea acidiphila]